METFSFVSLSYEYLMNIDGNTAVRRGSRKEAGKLVRGKSTFRILERRKSSVVRKNEGNKVERSNYRIKIQNFQLEKISVPIILIPLETEFTEFHEFKRSEIFHCCRNC